MKHIFIINPAAGKGDSSRVILPRIIRFVKNHGDEFEIHRSISKQEIGIYVKTRASKGDRVRFYAVGGDGTICDIVNGMIGYDNAELAVIPCGSGNDFVKNFSNREFFKVLNRQVNGRIEKIDVIKYNDEYCLNMINAGADCDICIEAERLRREEGQSGSASYVAAAKKILKDLPSYIFEYEDESGERHAETLMMIDLGNGKFCGGGFRSCTKAKLNDGLMDVACIRPVSGVKLPMLVLSYRNGSYIYSKMAKPYFTYRQVREFWLKPLQKVDACVDGEVFRLQETHAEVIPKAINFVVPEGCDFIDK